MPLIARGRTFLLLVWLSLATVFAHAVLPVGSPLARGTGSAFSISTTDVALNRGRRSVAAELKKHSGLAVPGEAGDGGSSWAPDAALPVPSGWAVERGATPDGPMVSRTSSPPARSASAPYHARAPPPA